MKTLALLTLLVPSIAVAQGGPPAATTPPPAAPAAPQLAPELGKLEFLIGEWVHEEVHPDTPSGVGAKGAARSKNTWIHDGHHLYHLYKSRRPDGRELEARGVMGWQTEARQYRFHWFDSTGAMTVYGGTFDPEGTLVLVAGTPDAGPHREIRIRRVEGKILFLFPGFESLAQPAPKSSDAPASPPAARPTAAPLAPTTK
jgi:hypothetical protein